MTAKQESQLTGSNHRLLLDPIHTSSPGGLPLQRELALAAARTKPPDWQLLALRYDRQFGFGKSNGIGIVEAETYASGWIEKWRRLNLALPRTIADYSVDVVFSLSGQITQRLLRRCGTICTVNNMLPFTPELMAGFSPAQRLKAKLQRAVLVRSLRLADAVVLHSAHALRQISRYAGDLSGKTRVVLTGVPATARLTGDPPPHPDSGQPYFFYLSAFRPYKNHLNLIEAYRRMLSADPDLPRLVFAGYPQDPDYVDQVREAIRRTGLQERIVYLGALPSDELQSRLHHADVNVFASLCETNSIIMAEMLGLGAVLACSNAASMPEVAGEAAEYFDPGDPEAISDTLLRLWRDPERRRQLRVLAAARADQLSWDECGRAVWASAESALRAFQKRTNSL